MPVGRVKWYSSEKGFGFVTAEDGQEIFLHASALPEGIRDVKPGTKLDFSIVDGRRGAQVLSAELVDGHPSLVKSQRKPADDMAVIVEDLIKLLDNTSNSLRRGRYPDDKTSAKVASVLRAVADDLDI
ncbi:MAG: cold shock domain-containing protein [Micrococcaceae bacterium]